MSWSTEVFQTIKINIIASKSGYNGPGAESESLMETTQFETNMSKLF